MYGIYVKTNKKLRDHEKTISAAVEYRSAMYVAHNGKAPRYVGSESVSNMHLTRGSGRVRQTYVRYCRCVWHASEVLQWLKSYATHVGDFETNARQLYAGRWPTVLHSS